MSFFLQILSNFLIILRNFVQHRFLCTLVLASALLAINHIGHARADVSSLTSERKINLEDIERDTLLNELHSKSQETLHAEPTEHVPPTAVGPGPVQHVQHTGPTAAPPTASGGAVSHQTIVYHQVKISFELYYLLLMQEFY